MLVEKAYPMGVTFHRAFDWTRNPFESLEDIIDIGCERILTSGQQPTAILGSHLIRDLVDQAGRTGSSSCPDPACGHQIFRI